MCGISGIYRFKNGNIKEIIRRMNAVQRRRGPDDEGIFIDEKNGVAIGHRRLSILDLSAAGKQPMKFGNLCVAFNGEIYNFLELRKDLEKRGYKFKTKTDTEVILALYAEYGEKSFAMLRGMFAFGLWDGKNQKLFLVKDRYGIKPLYYYSDNEKIVFASTVKALENSGIISVQENPEAYIGFLLFGSVPLPMTTVKNIFAVPSGYYLEINSDGDRKLVGYYDLLDAFLKKSDDNLETAKEKIFNLLKESVGLHLISDAPLGVFLSGGLDSSAIAALAAQNRKNPITTISIVFDEPEFSEQKYQRLVAEKIKSIHREIKITKNDFYNSFNGIFEAMDQPTIDGVNTFFIAKAAREAGLKAVLSGLGADEIFLGYPHFKKAELLKKIQKSPVFLKSPLKLVSLLGGKYSKLGYFINNNTPSFYLGVRGLFTPQETAKILDINLDEVEKFINNLAEFADPQTYEFKNLSAVDTLSYLELKLYLQNQLLKDTDFM
jgi:asparagine synthase (glutamine-hydrolysing)